MWFSSSFWDKSTIIEIKPPFINSTLLCRVCFCIKWREGVMRT
ncbi:hypothetical protein RGAI101_1657 [Roseobacter sp. GAI101]|nr:hypothetical protein RGAI101_1657 [Roseobacter sp. GAI101]